MKETLVTETSQDGFKILGISKRCDELSEILIKAFDKETRDNRLAMINNSFMVGVQVKIALGEEVYKQLDEFTEVDWKAAWISFDKYFYTKEYDYEDY